MTETDHSIRETELAFKRENTETGFTVRLHFKEEYKDDHILEEIQKILTETYIENLIQKEEKRET